MKRRVISSIIIVIIVAVTLFFLNNKEVNKDIFEIPSEKSFYKLSDLGTNVVQLTNNSENDGIFYQEPSYFSSNGKYFLFKSERDGNALMVMNLETGKSAFLKKNSMYGWAPAWNNNKIYLGGLSKIDVIDIENHNESKLDIKGSNVATFIHFNPSGNKMVFVEELFGNHRSLSIINADGTGYTELFLLDKENEFYLDHPTFINDEEILFLTRGKNRDFRDNYNKPYIINLKGEKRKLPVECSHYDINSKGDKIICATEGYIIDLNGNKLKELELRGHGAWHPNGETFLMSGDPIPVPDGPYFGKIVLMNFSNDEIVNLVSHESTYDSTLERHIQPNAQFSRDGNFVIYESDRGEGKNTDLFIVEI